MHYVFIEVATAKKSKASLPLEMELPSHYPPRLQEALDKSEAEHSRLDPVSRNHLIRVLSDFVYIKVQDPTSSDYATMAAAVVKRFPFLADSLPGVQCYVSGFKYSTSLTLICCAHTPALFPFTEHALPSVGFSEETAQPKV